MIVVALGVAEMVRKRQFNEECLRICQGVGLDLDSDKFCQALSMRPPAPETILDSHQIIGT